MPEGTPDEIPEKLLKKSKVQPQKELREEVIPEGISVNNNGRLPEGISKGITEGISQRTS